MESSGRETIPAFLSIDVEPDGFQISADGAPKWEGYKAAVAFAHELREKLGRCSGAAPRIGWYFRMDPQIELAYGRADDAVTACPEAIADLRACGDYFGVHMHPIRWSSEHQNWVHDFGDRAWLRQCTHFSLDAFENWNGSRARLFRSGAGFLHEDIVDVLDERGVDVEMSLEPMQSWGLDADNVSTGVDGSPIVGSFSNCASAPTVPYRPQRGEFRRRGNRDARSLVLVPLSSGPYAIPKSDWWSTAKRSVRRIRKPLNRHMYYPSSSWPSQRYYWDLVAHCLDNMKRPYLSLAVRTDAADSIPSRRVRGLFDEIARHPLGERLRFVNPLDWRDWLLGEARSTVAPMAGAGASFPVALA